MQKAVAKLILGILTLLFILPALAVGAAPFLKLNLEDSSHITGSAVVGQVIASESGLALTNGNIQIGDQSIPINEKGQFAVEGLRPGNYQATISGPHRRPKDLLVAVRPGRTEITVEVEPRFSPQEIDTLAQITRAEAEGEPEVGKTAVAATVLNRVDSPRYPNTIREVVYQRISGRYQYSPVLDGRINLAPRPQDYRAAFQALAGHDPSGGATGFFNAAKTRDRWVRSHPVTTQIGGHTFFEY